MRIAYLSADHGVPVLGAKGGSVHVQQFVAALAQLGHDVTLYCTRLGNGDPARLPVCVIEIERPVGAPFSVHTDEGGFPVSRERLQKELGWREHARALEARVAADHASSPFDMIYERYSLWSAAAARLTLRTGVPSVVEVNAPLLTEAEAYRELAAKRQAESIEAEVFARAGAVAAVSEGVRNYVISKGAAPSRVHVLPNGVDPSTFNPAVERAPMQQLAGHPVIGFAGGLKPWHGLQELLAAFRIVERTRPEARLLIVGDGPMRGWIDGFLAGSRLADKVVVTGWQEHHKLPSLLKCMDIATAPYPALDDFYFSPLKLFEYMSAGCAIVASRIGQIDAVIEHERTGLLCEPGSVDALAAQLVRLIDDAELRQRLGVGAVAGATRFTWQENARQAVELGAAQVGLAASRKREAIR